MNRIRVLMLVLGLVLQFGCKDNPYYCPDPDPAVCAESCTTTADCDDELIGRICDPSSMTCVQCTSVHIEACTATAPVCIDNACSQPCTEHARCSATSNVCLPTGTCAESSEVAYVDPAGTDNSGCTKEQPCIKVAEALGTLRPYIKFSGITNEAVTISGGQVVTFLADPNAKLTRGNTGDIVTVKNDNTSLSIYDLEIADATASEQPTPNGDGFGITAPLGAPRILLTRVTLRNNHVAIAAGGLQAANSIVTINQGMIHDNTGGIQMSNGTLVVNQSTIVRNGAGIGAASSNLTVTESTISNNRAAAIAASGNGGTITIARNMISGNLGGGVHILFSPERTFSITNNFIIHNGSLTGAGGVALHADTPGSTFTHNTVAFNASDGVFGGRGGVSCSAKRATLFSNVIYHNSEPDGAGGAKTDATTQRDGADGCAYGNSLISFGNSTHHGFRRPLTEPYDFHVTATSTFILGVGGLCSGVDFDGEERPIGGACELGADEFNPNQ